LVTKFVIAAGGKRHEREKRVTVAWAELPLDQVDELAREGGWKPAAADAAVARAYLALGRRKPKAAMKALERAGDHPLAEHVLGLTKVPPTPAGAARAGKPGGPAPTLTLDLGRGVKMEFVYVKPGVFMMGGTEDPKHGWQGVEKPKHKVAITLGFYIGKYEVTQAQYEAVMGGNPSKWKEPNRPVEQVTWHEATELCRLATERTRKQFRLPTEAEWEFACRASSTGRYCFGSDEGGLGDYAWYGSNSGGQTHPVGQKKPNAWGLHDVHGNVWEWVADRYAADYYADSPRENPTGPDTGNRRLLRGGSWSNYGRSCRSAFRNHNSPSSRYNSLGFRAALSASAAPSVTRSSGGDRASQNQTRDVNSFGALLTSPAGSVFVGDQLAGCLVGADGTVEAHKETRIRLMGTEGKDFLLSGEVMFAGSPHKAHMGGVEFFLRETDGKHRYEIAGGGLRAKRVLLNGRRLSKFAFPARFPGTRTQTWYKFIIDTSAARIAVQLGASQGVYPGPLSRAGANSIVLYPGGKIRNVRLRLKEHSAR
ncbi:MAG: formylglycine-generating enzyme family protein, partial [Planctomycetota bacterium]